MKTVLFAVVASVVLIVIIVLRADAPEIRRARYFGSPEPVLPMSFAHADHRTVRCIECHHNYVDNTGHENCMNCHVQREHLLPVIEAQFHAFCRGCHARLAGQGRKGGPVRGCRDCHHLESKP